MNAHVYKSPPIVQAVIEMRFDDYSQELGDILFPGKYVPTISERFDGETIEQKNLSTTINTQEGAQGVSTKETLARIQTFNKKKTRFVTVGSGSLTVGVQQPYCGWEEFKEDTKFALSKYLELAPNKSVLRIGLRYINQFNIPKGNEPGKYLVEAGNFHSFPDCDIENFYYRTTRRFSNGILMLINQAEQQLDVENQLLLDLDLIKQTDRITELEQILEVCDEMHTIEKTCFEELVSDEARKLFNA